MFLLTIVEKVHSVFDSVNTSSNEKDYLINLTTDILPYLDTIHQTFYIFKKQT